MRAEGRPIRWHSPSFSPLGLSSASHPLRNARGEHSIFAVVIGLVTTWTGYIRSAGLDPHILWLEPDATVRSELRAFGVVPGEEFHSGQRILMCAQQAHIGVC